MTELNRQIHHPGPLLRCKESSALSELLGLGHMDHFSTSRRAALFDGGDLADDQFSRASHPRCFPLPAPTGQFLHGQHEHAQQLIELIGDVGVVQQLQNVTSERTERNRVQQCSSAGSAFSSSGVRVSRTCLVTLSLLSRRER